jgi:CBS-domain-containing membrane protein
MHHEAISEEKNRNWAHDPGVAAGRFVCAQDLMQRNPVFLRIYSTIQQAMEAFRKQGMSSLLAIGENPLDESMCLSGRVCLKDVFRQLFICLMQKDLISLNQALHKPIENILIYSQQTVDPKSDIAKILSVMLVDYPYVMGVGQSGKLLGQICCRDLLELFKPIDGKDSPWIQLIRQALPESAKVSRAMARHVLCLSPKDEISKAVGVFMATATFNIPILDEKGNLERIISQMDALEYVLNLIESKELAVFEKKGLILDRTIGSLDEKEFAMVSGDDSLVDAAEKMIKKNIFCLAVTDIHRRFCGLLAFTDILRWVHAQLKEQVQQPIS